MAAPLQDNRRIAKNTLNLYIRMFFVLVVNLYLMRVLLHTLGITDYGTYTIVIGFVTLFGFFNTTLSSTIQRYYNYAGTKDGERGLQQVFSNGFYIHVLLAVVVLILLETGGLWYIYNRLVVPPSRFTATLLLFHASAVSMVFMILQIPFVSLIISQERMGYYSAVSIIDILLKLAATLSLSKLSSDHLSSYGLMLCCISLFNFLLYSGYAMYVWRFLRLSRSIDTEVIRSLMSFTGWNLMGTFAFMLRGQGISLLLNSFFGPVVNAARGLAMQVTNAIANFSTNISVAFSPQVINAVAADDNRRAEQLFFTESKICFAMLLTLAVPLCLEMDYVLGLWLGDSVPPNTGIFSILMIVDAVICTLNTPCTQLTMATGQIRNYEIASTVINICLLPCCYLFLNMGFDATSSFVITIIFSIILQTACLLITHRYFRFNFRVYLSDVLLPCLIMAVILPIIPMAFKTLLPQSFIRLFCLCVIDLAVALPLCYFVLLNSDEKQKTRQFVRSRLTNRNSTTI